MAYIKYHDFDLLSIPFVYDFTKDTCNRLKTGICSLDEYSGELNRADYSHDIFRKVYPKCVSMYYAIINDMIYALPPLYYKCKCGHYMCQDGQHRICIARKMKIKLKEVEFNDAYIDDNCFDCSGRNEEANG